MPPSQVSKRQAHSERSKMAQEQRFLAAIGVEGLQSMTYEEIGEVLGISLERARQIIQCNPALRGIRHQPKAGRDELAARALQQIGPLMDGGQSLEEAAATIGTTLNDLEAAAMAHQGLWDFLEACRTKAKRDRNNQDLLRFKQAADHALAEKMTFRAACHALGYEYDHMLRVRFPLGDELANSEPYRELFNPDLRIAQDVAIARERILQGARVSDCAEGLETHPATIRRHLKGDPEVDALIRSRRGFQPRSS